MHDRREGQKLLVRKSTENLNILIKGMKRWNQMRMKSKEQKDTNI